MNADQENSICSGDVSSICVHPRSSAAHSLLQPQSRVPIATRVATSADLPFIDGLQKQHSRALGFFPRAQMEGYVANQWVLIAEEVSGQSSVVSCGGDGQRTTDNGLRAKPVGYCISRDRYLKRDELGVIYQLCVAPGHQRGLIGASLVKAVFERSAYGCKLYCCWCAQDLEANYFWESMGFVPIAFRAGSTGKRRVHIFWQRRINAQDTGERATPYWYPCQTNAGAIREDRLVFPIPPGTHWTEVQAVALPSTALTAPREAKMRRGTKAQGALQPPPQPPPSRPSAGRQYGPPSAGPIVEETQKPAPTAGEKPPREKRPPLKIDPKLVAKARELRDRYLEHVNGERLNESPKAMIAPSGKYDVSRRFAAPDAPRALPNAA